MQSVEESGDCKVPRTQGPRTISCTVKPRGVLSGACLLKRGGEGRRPRVLAISVLIAVPIGAVILHSVIQELIDPHLWLFHPLVGLSEIAACLFAWRELTHSAEANVLRREGNDLRGEANRLRRRVAELEEEKTGRLKQIAHEVPRAKAKRLEHGCASPRQWKSTSWKQKVVTKEKQERSSHLPKRAIY
jgi:hypothetical protein